MFSAIASQPDKAEILINAATELTGEAEEWLLPKVQTGGLVGLNAGTISSVYSMGNVVGSWFTGGISGYNSGVITDSFAINAALLNSSSYSMGMSFGRITGFNSGTLEQNYANKYMQEPYTGAFTDITQSGKDGANLED